MRILVVEDERKMADLLGQAFREEAYQVHVAHDGPTGVKTAQSTSFDVIVLDVMLPGLDGFGVVQKLRQGGNRTPVLMLTARDAASDIVTGLDHGADDYLTKPFSIDVLMARVRALSRRNPIPRSNILQTGDLQLDPARRAVTRAGRALNLTPREYKLLELLMQNRDHVVSRDKILESVWGFDTDVSENTVEVFMGHLRQKIDFREPKLIQTVRGFGYVLREPSAEPGQREP